MRIIEVVDKNEIFIMLKGFDTEFNETYLLTLNAYQLFSKTRHLSKLAKLKLQVDKFCSELTEFIEYDWPDKTDTDIISMLEKATQIRDRLNSLKF